MLLGFFLVEKYNICRLDGVEGMSCRGKGLILDDGRNKTSSYDQTLSEGYACARKSEGFES